MLMWLYLATQLSLPVETSGGEHDVRTVFSGNDFPARVLAEGVNRFVFTRTTVRPDGKTQDCTVEGGGSGDAQLDAYTCAIIMRRARFAPARWADGSPTYGVVRVSVNWTPRGPLTKPEESMAHPVDANLSVTRLPVGADRQTTLRLMIAVDETGRVLECDAARPSLQSDNGVKFPDLVPVACDFLVNQYHAIPAKDATGKSVSSVQTAIVRLSAGS